MLGHTLKRVPMRPDFSYSLDTLKLILKLSEHCILSDTKNIFIQTANETALLYLQQAITTFKDTEIRNARELYDDFQEHLHAVIVASKLGAESSHDQTDSMDIEFNRLTLDGVTEVEWSVLLKLSIQNSPLVNADSISVHTAWLVLMKQLRNIYVRYKKEMEKDNDISLFELKDALSFNVMRQYIGQLVQLGEVHSAFTLHQYLRILKLAYKKNEINDLDEEKVGLILAATLGDGLNIAPHLHTDEHLIAESGMSEAVIKEKSVKTFLKFLFKNMLNNNFFEKEFHPEVYANYKQDEWESRYKSILTKIIDEELQPPEKHQINPVEMEQAQPKLRNKSNKSKSKGRRFSLRTKIKEVAAPRASAPRVVSCAYSKPPVLPMYQQNSSLKPELAYAESLNGSGVIKRNRQI